MLTKDNKSFCVTCLKDVDFKTLEEEDTGPIKDKEYSFMRLVAHCVHCNEELDVYNDENIKRLYDSYRGVHGLISLEKIREIPIMYGISKRILSVMLGWGEQTFPRYYDGYLPTKPYSKILENLYSNPAYYSSLLEQHKNALGIYRYNKSKRAVDKLINSGFEGLAEISRIATYLLNSKTEMTKLSLQKLLYYVQSFSSVFLGKSLFQIQSEAWAYGPVYRDIYDLYNENPDYIKQYSDDTPLSTEEKELVDAVVDCFGCYDGDILREFTHRETPWMEARGNLPPTERSNEKISLDSIKNYFTGIKEKYNMTKPSDMKAYARDMFDVVTA